MIAANHIRYPFRPAIVLAVLAIIAFSTAAAHAAGKVALVIGNNDYTHAPKLANPVNDARAVAKVLKKIGFKVLEHYDVTKRDADGIMERFAAETASAQIGLVYFAGHGIQVSGTTYLVPVDVSLDSDRDLRKLIPADYLLQDASQARTVGVVILDACRDNPFIKRLSEATAENTRSVAVGRGLSRIDAVPKKGLIAYATQAGNVALDTTGDRNSPYATALVRHLGSPDKDIRLVFGAIRDEVIELTGRKQEPYTYGSLGGDQIFLNDTGDTTTVKTDEDDEEDETITAVLSEDDLDTSIPVTADYVTWKSAVEKGSWSGLSRLASSDEANLFVYVARHLRSMRNSEPNLSVRAAMRNLRRQTLDYNRMSPALILMVQASLRDLNYYGGDVDGKFGRESQSAYEAFVQDWERGLGDSSAALVALAVRASERGAQSAFTGKWRGQYRYPPGSSQAPVSFDMDLTFSQGTVSGFIVEPATFGNKTSKNLYATFAGTVNGNTVEWKKTYDGTGGVSHSVIYRGELDRDRRTITGRWRLGPNWGGTFNIELD